MFHFSAGKAVATPVEWKQGEPAALQWARARTKASEEGLRLLEALYAEEIGKGNPNEERVEDKRCRQQLLLYSKAVLATLEWSVDQRKAGQILSTDTDEEGNFKIQVPYPGTYSLIARGRAGIEEAFWTMDNVLVEQGMETTVKVTRAEETCLVN